MFEYLTVSSTWQHYTVDEGEGVGWGVDSWHIFPASKHTEKGVRSPCGVLRHSHLWADIRLWWAKKCCGIWPTTQYIMRCARLWRQQAQQTLTGFHTCGLGFWNFFALCSPEIWAYDLVFCVFVFPPCIFLYGGWWEQVVRVGDGKVSFWDIGEWNVF